MQALSKVSRMETQHVRGMLLATAVSLTTLAIAAPPAAAAPVTVNYPSSGCPVAGDHGLQDCIDGVDPGSTVILTTEIIDEAAFINKSLTLRAVDRTLQPVLLGVGINSPSTGAAKIVVQDIRLSLTILVNLTTGSGHSVTIQRVDIGRGAPGPRGIIVQSDVPATIAIENSFIRSDQENEASVLTLATQNSSGLVHYRVVGNKITAHGDTKSNAGIDLIMEGSGTVVADIYNNVIWDVATCHCGAASGIAVLPDPKVRADVNIVGNTIDNSRTDAIQQRNDLTTGRLYLDVFNNILTHNSSEALNLESGKPGSLVFRAGFNDRFANGNPDNLDGQSAGPGNLNLDPRYVNPNARDLHLQSNSPLNNKGATCSPGGIADPDAAGRHRLNGPEVDIGAYEIGGVAITGVVRVGTSAAETLNGTNGQDILCGYGGADILKGLNASDYLDGGSGPDRVVGGSGVDRVFGNLDNDHLCTLDGTSGDLADGGPGADTAVTDPGDTRVSIEGTGGC
jgi:hypothetical protein